MAGSHVNENALYVCVQHQSICGQVSTKGFETEHKHLFYTVIILGNDGIKSLLTNYTCKCMGNVFSNE